MPNNADDTPWDPLFPRKRGLDDASTASALSAPISTDPGSASDSVGAFDSLFAPTPAARVRKPRPELTPTQRAIGLLSRREHSRKELKRKLAAKGVERDAIDHAVDKLSDAGWQDDGRFATSLARMRANTGYGPIRIRAELGTHGLDADAIRAALDAIASEIDWRESARDLVRRRVGSMRDASLAARRKAADLLIRRGFDSDTVRAATRFEPDDEM